MVIVSWLVVLFCFVSLCLSLCLFCFFVCVITFVSSCELLRFCFVVNVIAFVLFGRMY